MYKLDFSSQALDFYNKLYFHGRKDFSRIDAALESLQISPFKGKALKHDFKGKYSLRVGSYRIIYKIVRETITVYIFDIGHRRNVYN